jgi:hypothetical protein
MVERISYQYIAGFVDGEGHIGLCKRKKHKVGHYNYQPTLMIANTDRYVLELIREKVGGQFHKFINISSYSKRPYLYRLVIQKQDVLYSVIENIYPHLIIKKEQARILLDYIKLRKSKQKNFIQSGCGARAPYGEEEHILYNKMFKLSARGEKRI